MKYDLLSQFSKVFNRIIFHFIFSCMQIIAFLLFSLHICSCIKCEIKLIIKANLKFIERKSHKGKEKPLHFPTTLGD
jgi:hypothetical protein